MAQTPSKEDLEKMSVTDLLALARQRRIRGITVVTIREVNLDHCFNLNLAETKALIAALLGENQIPS